MSRSCSTQMEESCVRNLSVFVFNIRLNENKVAWTLRFYQINSQYFYFILLFSLNKRLARGSRKDVISNRGGSDGISLIAVL